MAQRYDLSTKITFKDGRTQWKRMGSLFINDDGSPGTVVIDGGWKLYAFEPNARGQGQGGRPQGGGGNYQGGGRQGGGYPQGGGQQGYQNRPPRRPQPQAQDVYRQPEPRLPEDPDDEMPF